MEKRVDPLSIEMSRGKIVIFGNFSGNNLGDKAILLSMVQNFEQKFSISVPSKMPENICDIKGINPFKTVTAFIGMRTIGNVKNADVVVIGGGGLFFDYKIYNPFFNFLSNMFIIAILSNIFNKKLYLFSVGAHHLDSKISRIISKQILSQANIITVRDNESKKVLEGISQKQVEVYHDPVFLLEGTNNDYVQTIKKKFLKNRDAIILNLHKSLTYRYKLNMIKKEFDQKLIQIVDQFAQQGYVILLFSTVNKNQYLDDLVKYSSFQENYIRLDNSRMNPQNMIELLKGSKFILGSQLHALILSTVANVPSIGFVYDEKVLSFLKFTHQDDQAIFLHELDDLTLLKEKIEFVLENNESIRAGLPGILSEIRSNAHINFVKLETVINEEKND